ncbi:MAG: LysM peptidoglycan-binding domain-containing protein, partial [Clostridia bacterium]|nr:LysM peptidoglycan-binding domain-containing protein [Clostridia bacterium]
MKKLIAGTLIITGVFTSLPASAATHTVKSGDTMWKIAVKYEAGLAEIIEANPQIENPALIYPGDIL